MSSTGATGTAEEFHTTHDWESDVSLRVTIVKAVAAVKGVNSTDLAPLHTAVDPDSLEQLESWNGNSASSNGKEHITFTFEGYQVVVTSNGDVTVRRPPVVSTEQEFHAALNLLIREAEAAGVAVEGGWDCRSESASRKWGMEIYEVNKSGHQ